MCVIPSHILSQWPLKDQMVEGWFCYLTTASLAPSSHRYHISPCIFPSLFFLTYTHTLSFLLAHINTNTSFLTHIHSVLHLPSFTHIQTQSPCYSDSSEALCLQGAKPNSWRWQQGLKGYRRHL